MNTALDRRFFREILASVSFEDRQTLQQEDEAYHKKMISNTKKNTAGSGAMTADQRRGSYSVSRASSLYDPSEADGGLTSSHAYSQQRRGYGYGTALEEGGYDTTETRFATEEEIERMRAQQRQEQREREELEAKKKASSGPNAATRTVIRCMKLALNTALEAIGDRQRERRLVADRDFDAKSRILFKYAEEDSSLPPTITAASSSAVKKNQRLFRPTRQRGAGGGFMSNCCGGSAVRKAVMDSGSEDSDFGTDTSGDEMMSPQELPGVGESRRDGEGNGPVHRRGFSSVRFDTGSNKTSTGRDGIKPDGTPSGGADEDEESGGLSSFAFTSYSPMCYRHIRDFFGVSSEDFRNVLCNSGWFSIPTPGKSAAQLFFCGQNWVIKTTNLEESKFLRRILHRYYDHVRDNRFTLLPRFMGHYRLQIPGQDTITFVIMQNVFATPNKIDEKFDLKGSTIGRFSSKQEKTQATRTKKDLDINRPINLGPARRALLIDQIKADCNFLRQSDIMDYSLLVGIHHIPEGQPIDESSLGFPPFPPSLPSASTASPQGLQQQQQKAFWGPSGGGPFVSDEGGGGATGASVPTMSFFANGRGGVPAAESGGVRGMMSSSTLSMPNGASNPPTPRPSLTTSNHKDQNQDNGNKAVDNNNNNAPQPLPSAEVLAYSPRHSGPPTPRPRTAGEEEETGTGFKGTPSQQSTTLRKGGARLMSPQAPSVLWGALYQNHTSERGGGGGLVVRDSGGGQIFSSSSFPATANTSGNETNAYYYPTTHNNSESLAPVANGGIIVRSEQTVPVNVQIALGPLSTIDRKEVHEGNSSGETPPLTLAGAPVHTRVLSSSAFLAGTLNSNIATSSVLLTGKQVSTNHQPSPLDVSVGGHQQQLNRPQPANHHHHAFLHKISALPYVTPRQAVGSNVAMSSTRLQQQLQNTVATAADYNSNAPHINNNVIAGLAFGSELPVTIVAEEVYGNVDGFDKSCFMAYQGGMLSERVKPYAVYASASATSPTTFAAAAAAGGEDNMGRATSGGSNNSPQLAAKQRRGGGADGGDVVNNVDLSLDEDEHDQHATAAAASFDQRRQHSRHHHRHHTNSRNHGPNNTNNNNGTNNGASITSPPAAAGSAAPALPPPSLHGVGIENILGANAAAYSYTPPFSSSGGEGRAREVYYIGIIDILQEYNARKTAETFFKSLVDERAKVSSLPAKEYAARFVSFMSSVVV